MSRDPETSAASSPRISTPSRRTILTGAAWSVPVIAAASVAPIAAAASNVPVLAFNQTTYNGTACGTITGAYVTVTVGGVPTAGQSVTVTLSGGYTFSGGSTTYTGVSDGSGAVSLPAVTVPPQGGNGSAVATSGASVTATLSAPPVGAAKRYVNQSGGVTQSNSSVPAGSTPVGGLGYLTAAGDLYFGNTKVASGVSKAAGGIDPYQHYVIEYVSSTDGRARRYTTQSGSEYQDYFSVPINSTPVGGMGFLTPAGDLYFTNTKVASGVSKAVGGIDGYQHYVIEYVSSTDGRARRYTTQSGSEHQDYFSVPINSTPVGGLGFLTPAGDLYFGNTKVASGVSKAFGGIDWYQHYVIEYVSSTDGLARRYTTQSGSEYQDYFSVPINSTPVGGMGFLTPAGDLYFTNTKVASGVSKAVGGIDAWGTYVIEYTNAPAC